MSPRWMVLVSLSGLMGCSSFYREDPCGRSRSVTAAGAVIGLPADSNASLTVTDQDSNPRLALVDGLTWRIPITIDGDSVTAIHIHDATPGRDNRVVYFVPDYGLGSGVQLEGTTDYSYSTPIRTLFELVLSGRTYLDVHTAAHPEGVARADLTSVQVQDWTGYYCS